MAFSEAKLMKLAKLSRIKIEKHDIPKYTQDILEIIDVISELQSVDTYNVEPLISVNNGATPMRCDVVTEPNNLEQILKNAPDSRYNCFVVPKVVE
jgi:aspartyl-tRNA(Asn)/glutamyl-tRNA(Gln) amidotransferase subunit C